MGNYVEDNDLWYEIVLSKGKGYLTKKAEKMLILIAQKVMKKLERRYNSEDDKLDCLQQGILHLLSKWNGFDERKFPKALPYFSEIAKRGMADGLGLIHNKKFHKNDKDSKIISLDSSNDGKGLHSI
jgi:hypothetical protein